jgi:hypothetical protein
MADQNRKNIYISEDQMEMFKQAEEFAKNNNISLSMLVTKSVSKFVSDAVKNAGEVSLMIKTYDDNSVIPVINYIKFNGEEIVKDPYKIDYDCNTNDPTKSIDKYKMVYDKKNYNKNDELGHEYTIYETKKGKYLLYINRIQTRYVCNDEYYDDNCERVIIREVCSYNVYDDLKSLVENLGELDNATISELAKHESTTEYLDI